MGFSSTSAASPSLTPFGVLLPLYHSMPSEASSHLSASLAEVELLKARCLKNPIFTWAKQRAYVDHICSMALCLTHTHTVLLFRNLAFAHLLKSSLLKNADLLNVCMSSYFFKVQLQWLIQNEQLCLICSLATIFKRKRTGTCILHGERLP